MAASHDDSAEYAAPVTAEAAWKTDGIEYLLWREQLDDGTVTTLYAVRHPRAATRTRVVHFPETERLDVWCAAHHVDEAVIGGFFLRDPYRPLGDLWVDGSEVPHEQIVEPYGSQRACVLVEDGDTRLAAREDAPASPSGDLVHAGPLLVRGGAVVYDPSEDPEGFSAGSGQFDSDITQGRHPRAALGLSDAFVWRSRATDAVHASTAASRCPSSRGCWSSSESRARSTSTEEAPRRSSTAGIC